MADEAEPATGRLFDRRRAVGRFVRSTVLKLQADPGGRRRHRDETISLDISRGETDATLGSSLPGKSISPEAQAIASERERRIMKALGEIKQEYRVALILREIEELSYEEIAETLQVSIGTVKSRIARGREELRRRVKNLI